MQKILNTTFEIQVQVSFVPAESKPEANYYFFSYRITVINSGASSAQLMSRHWIITDGHGQVEEVRGAGVVGQQPKVSPGQKFEYESVCPLSTSSGSMRGFYQMISESGDQFDVEIPEFYLIAPSALH